MDVLHLYLKCKSFIPSAVILRSVAASTFALSVSNYIIARFFFRFAFPTLLFFRNREARRIRYRSSILLGPRFAIILCFSMARQFRSTKR